MKSFLNNFDEVSTNTDNCRQSKNLKQLGSVMCFSIVLIVQQMRKGYKTTENPGSFSKKLMYV